MTMILIGEVTLRIAFRVTVPKAVGGKISTLFQVVKKCAIEGVLCVLSPTGTSAYFVG